MKLFSVQGLKFNGLGSNCVVDGNIGVIGIKSQMSMRIRFKVISSSFGYDILKKDGEYRLSVNGNGNIEFSVWDGTDWLPCVVGSEVSIGNWYDVIVTVSVGGGVISKVMYVNSVNDMFSESSQSGSVSQTINNLVIGDSEVIVDNFMVWSKILSESEVELIFNGGVVFNMLDFWLAFEDVEEGSDETTEVVYKRYKGVLNNYEIVDGKE